jgi:hydrogenase expression/formation protein HypE
MSGKDASILLSHGSGGKLTHDLVNKIFLPGFSNPALDELGDSAILVIGKSRIAFTTDTFVVKPIFFPGGDIGHLSICGTVNDLAVSGARPVAISAGFIIEEGFPFSHLERIVQSMRDAAIAAGVVIAAGDTKVVEKGSADGIFINTSGVGAMEDGLISGEPIAPGDKIIVNGTLGDHGIAVLSARENLPVESDIVSDAAPLNTLIFPILKKFPGKVKFMRDATRGGLATVMSEIAIGRHYGISLLENKIPVREAVSAICEMLGLDPLYVANEGKAVFVVKSGSAQEILEFMRTQPLGRDAAIIGEVTKDHPGRVTLETFIGGGRILDMLVGDQLPRIC